MRLEIISDIYYFLKSAIWGIQKYISIIYKYIQDYWSTFFLLCFLL